MRCDPKQTVTENLGVATLRSQTFILAAILSLAGASQAPGQFQSSIPEPGLVEGPRSTPHSRGLRWADAKAPVEAGDPQPNFVERRIALIDDATPLDEPALDPIPSTAAEEVTAPAAMTPAGPPMIDGPTWDEDYWQGGHEPPAPTCTSGTWFNRGKWYARQDFVYMNRFGRDVRQLVADYTNYNPNVPGARPFEVDQSQRTLGFEPGGRLTLGRFLCRDKKNRDHSLEFVFFGLFDWQQSNGMIARSEDSLFTLIDPFRTTENQVGGFNSAQQQVWNYESSFDSFELNYVLAQRLGRDRLEMTPEGEWVRKQTSDHISTWLAGVRYISIGEGFNWSSIADEIPDDADLDDEVERAAATGEYKVTTINKMLGLQFGHELVVQRPKWRFGIRNKIGSYINYARQETEVEIDDDTFGDQTRDESGSSHDLSFIYDLHVMLAYHIRPNLAVRTGYDFMLINQVALAPDQLTFVPSSAPRIVDGGALIVNGVSLGVEMVW